MLVAQTALKQSLSRYELEYDVDYYLVFKYLVIVFRSRQSQKMRRIATSTATQREATKGLHQNG